MIYHIFESYLIYNVMGWLFNSRKNYFHVKSKDLHLKNHLTFFTLAKPDKHLVSETGESDQRRCKKSEQFYKIS